MSENSAPTRIEAGLLREAPGVTHGFFTRQGGVSEGVYASLNCGIGSLDQRPRVVENRARVAARLAVPATHLLTCRQSHSARAVVASVPWTCEDGPKVDAIVTATPGLAVAVLAADCAPVLLADANAGVVAAAHAGWRGALGGILEATLTAMEGQGARRNDVRAAVGPCIGPDAYEVGAEFEAQFVNADPANARYFRTLHPGTRPRFDLPAYVVDRLERAGVPTVGASGQCTYLNDALFFSFRRATHRNEPDYGRQLSAIVLR